MKMGGYISLEFYANSARMGKEESDNGYSTCLENRRPKGLRVRVSPLPPRIRIFMSQNEIQKLKEEIRQLKEVLRKQEKEFKRAKLLTDYDALTGLYNRRGFMSESEKFIKEVRPKEARAKKRRFHIENFSIIFIDLDNLKRVNDLYGHKIGDKFIKMVGNILQEYLRDIDIVARWGGDEFVVGLVNLNEEQACKVAKKLKKKISLIKISKIKIDFSASFGIVAAKDKNHSIFYLPELIEKADMAMYEAKKEKNKGGLVVTYKDLINKKFD